MRKYAILTLFATLALANASAAAPDYALQWYGINPGNRMAGEAYSLTTSSGLAAANKCSGEDFVVLGGYLGSTIESIRSLYLPAVNNGTDVPTVITFLEESGHEIQSQPRQVVCYLPAVAGQ